MANTPITRDYLILITDPALYTALSQQYPDGYPHCPTTASTVFGIPFLASGLRPPYIQSISGTSPTSIPALTADSATYAAGTVVTSDFNVVSVSALVNSTGGTVTWRGYFQPAGIRTPSTAEVTQTRRWICGFEIPTLGDGGSGQGTHFSRDASRTVDGQGYAYRNLNNEGKTFTLPTASSSSWERFYMRVRTRPAGNEYFWYCGVSAEASAVLLAITSTGQLKIYNKGNQAFPGTAIGTIPASYLPLNTWVKIDLILEFPLLATMGGRFRLWINGTLIVDIPVSTASGGGGGLATAQLHTSSTIGNEGSVATQGGEFDFDDWINCTVPTLFTGTDWVNGSHIQRVMPTGFGTTHSGNWSGDYRVLAGNPVYGQPIGNIVSCTVVGPSTMDVTTDYSDRFMGCAAVSVGWYAISSGAVTAALGWSINGAAADTANKAVTQTVWATRLFNNTGAVSLPNLTSLNLIYIKSTAGTQQVQALQAIAEFIGTFAAEDLPTAAFPPRSGIHNAPYWDGPWSNTQGTPISPVSVMSGTYTGNGTGQDITTSMPVHWFWVRPLAGSTGGAKWFSSMLAGHDVGNTLPTTNRFVRAFVDRSGTDPVYKTVISGSDAQINGNGVTYQWVAFSDGGMRYCMNGAGAHISSQATSVNTLPDAGFTPQAAFLMPESLTGVANKLYYRGTGFGTTDASPITTTLVASVASFAAGSITSKATQLNTDQPQFAYSAWRTNDGSGTGPVWITNYTGNGGGNRTIALTLGGRVPIFAIVVPHNGVSYFRDPSHTGTTSSTVDGTADAATAIRGGAADSLLVGSVLNTNAVVYDVFVLAGSDTGNANGWTDNPTSPIYLTVTSPRPTPGPFAPTDTKGWWMSTVKFAGSASLITTPNNPQHPRAWDKVAAFATGNAAMLGGSPGAGVTYNNHLFYAGDNYVLGTDSPTIRVYDGASDRLFVTVPTVSGTVAQAVVSMILVGTTIYFSTLDSGTTSANFAGRVFSLDVLSGDVAQLGAGFGSGEVPYALCWHQGRLWCGTNKSSGAGGKIYFFRPGLDTTWTTDYTLATSTAGSCCSLASYQGVLYVGCDAVGGTFAKVLARDPLGAYTTSLTAASGVATLNNGFLSMRVFNGYLFAAYWNPDAPNIAQIRRFDGTTWVLMYTGASGTIRPYMGMFDSDNYLFVVGGGNALSAALLGSADGTAWSDLTTFLSGPTTETALPIFGKVGL